MTGLQTYRIAGAWIVFFTVYGALALGHLPFFRLDRTGVAFVGAVAMVSTLAGNLTLIGSIDRT